MKYSQFLKDDPKFLEYVANKVTSTDPNPIWKDARTVYSYKNTNMSLDEQEVLGMMMKKVTPHPREFYDNYQRRDRGQWMWRTYNRKEFRTHGR